MITATYFAFAASLRPLSSALCYILSSHLILSKGKASQLISLLFMCVALDVLWCVVKGSVMTDDTSGSHNNEVHTEGTDSISAGGTSAFNSYI